jgi:hypothetical protein
MPSIPTGGWKIVLAPAAMLALFTVVNILNYVDRGIVPGAFGPLGDYIRADIHQNDTDTYTGILQSEILFLSSCSAATSCRTIWLAGSFIGGYSVASISFGHMVHTYPPFRLMSVGLAIWTVAVLLRCVLLRWRRSFDIEKPALLYYPFAFPLHMHSMRLFLQWSCTLYHHRRPILLVPRVCPCIVWRRRGEFSNRRSAVY